MLPLYELLQVNVMRVFLPQAGEKACMRQEFQAKELWASSPKGGKPMAEFLWNVVAAIVAGVVVAIITRCINK
jgi:hypothetical protein